MTPPNEQSADPTPPTDSDRFRTLFTVTGLQVPDDRLDSDSPTYAGLLGLIGAVRGHSYGETPPATAFRADAVRATSFRTDGVRADAVRADGGRD